MCNDIKVIICGDYCPQHRVEELCENESYPNIFCDNVIKELKDKDFSIVNLECTLTDSKNQIVKNGPNHKSNKSAIAPLVYASFDMVTLANNHIMDYGTEGLLDTLEV